MKKFLLGFITCLGLLSPSLMKAQTFGPTSDTVRANLVAGNEIVYDNIIVPAGPSATVYWFVKATDFPDDWLTNAAFGLCDGGLCRNNLNDTLLWRVALKTPGRVFKCTYPAGTGTFDYTPNLAATSFATFTGCHYVTVQMTDSVATTKQFTFLICKVPLSTPSITNVNSEENVMLYPNPANSEVNVVYDANADVKSLAVYNIIGKMMTVYKVAGNSANVSLEGMPSGIYFLKLYNSKGNVVTTRKFTKQ